VVVVSREGREFILVGTAHVSRESAELVRRVIEQESPDCVCVELDEQRHAALLHQTRWESLDLRQIVRARQLPAVVVQLLLAAYQRRLGRKLGAMPGAELLQAVEVARERGIPFVLADRPVRATMLRAWRSLSFWRKNELLAAILAAMFSKEEISEEELRRLRQQDVLSEVLRELAEAFPTLSRVLIGERDLYLARKIREAPGARVVAVIGAGHVEGVRRALTGEPPELPELRELEAVPPASSAWKWAGWAIPLVVLGGLVAIGWKSGAAVAGKSLLYFVMVTSIPSGIGALLAAAHPLTILAAVVAAPIASLHPLIGCGYVTALVQAWVCPPRVRDLERVTEEVAVLRCWWSNRLLRVVLAFVLPTLGTAVGTYLGGWEIVSKFF
jgi:pheromone shutdown-related protein TraB